MYAGVEEGTHSCIDEQQKGNLVDLTQVESCALSLGLCEVFQQHVFVHSVLNHQTEHCYEEPQREHAAVHHRQRQSFEDVGVSTSNVELRRLEKIIELLLSLLGAPLFFLLIQHVHATPHDQSSVQELYYRKKERINRNGSKDILHQVVLSESEVGLQVDPQHHEYRVDGNG